MHQTAYPGIHILKNTDISIDQMNQTLIEAGYQRHSTATDAHTFTIKGPHITVYIDQHTNLIVRIQQNRIATLMVYDHHQDQTTPIPSYILDNITGTPQITCTLESNPPQCIVSPILIPIFLSQSHKTSMMSVDNWHSLLHHHPIALQTHHDFLHTFPLPKATDDQDAPATITCHPSSATPLMGTNYDASTYTLLCDTTPDSSRIWMRDTPPHPFYWGRWLILPLPAPHGQQQSLAFEKSFAFVTNDYVMHIEYGLGQFKGIVCFDDDQKSIDCLHIQYAHDTHIYIPVTEAHTIHFFAHHDEDIAVNDINSKTWLITKKKHAQNIQEFANHLLAIAAKRALYTAPNIPTDHHLLENFAQHFPHALTPDQTTALNDIIMDLCKNKPMNRLLCADVAFGKTEVSMRAAFIAASQGWQVIVIAPTVLLCLQHFERYQKRFSAFGITAAMLSKLTTAKERTQTINALKEQRVDILFTTHAAFHQSIHMPLLGLCILDEEHLFGVAQKESIKERYPQAHILSLSATPIPRTLHMALSGIQSLSVLSTPPTTLKKVPVHIELAPARAHTIKTFIQERLQHGQIFFIVPHIKNLPFYENILHNIAPFITMHGQSPPAHLRTSIHRFMSGDVPILLSTNIVGLGMDIPRVNTLIVADAHLFGLSQLYQLKGRVGRHQQSGQALFLHPPTHELTENAKKRLEYIARNTTLGSHMAVAQFDMKMRGTGRMVGKEQAGHYFNLGPSLYQTLLANAVTKAQNSQSDNDASPTLPATVTFPYPARISSHYIPNDNERINIYRMSTRIQTLSELQKLSEECRQTYGPYDTDTHNWFALMAIKLHAQQYDMASLSIRADGLTMTWHKHADFLKKNTEAIIDILSHPRIQPCGEDGLMYQCAIGRIDHILDAFHDAIKILDLTPTPHH